MMSDRQIKVEKVIQIRYFIQALVVTGFWFPFLYNWAWLLGSLETSVIYSLLIGVSGIGLLYRPWLNTTARLRRLQKYEILFSPFFEAMITDMDANDAEKGDSWLSNDLLELMELYQKKHEKLMDEFGPAPTILDINEELAKLSNYCAMIYLRRLEFA